MAHFRKNPYIVYLNNEQTNQQKKERKKKKKVLFKTNVEERM